MKKGLGPLAAALVVMGLSGAAAAYQPGWYFSASGASSSIDDADGRLLTSLTSSSDTTTTEPCLLSDILGDTPLLGGLVGGLDALLGTTGVSNGCLLTLLGPGTTTGGSSDSSQLNNVPLQVRFDGGFAVGASVGYLFEGGFRPELSLNFSENDITGARAFPASGPIATAESGKLRATRIGANLWYDLDFGGSIMPYFGVGLGFQDADIEFDGIDDSDSGTFYQAGAGVSAWLSRRTALFLDYRYIVSDDVAHSSSSTATNGGTTITTNVTQDFEHRVQQVTAGLRFTFSDAPMTDTDGDGVADRYDRCPNTPKNVQVDSTGCPLDSDGDGVPDYQDQCPNTPPGTPVEPNGCPVDSDGDGVPDALDKCPNTPRGVEVDASGCPLDSDGDGVPDSRDKCPGTPKGVEVDADGCPATDADGDGVPDFRDLCPDSPPGVPVGEDGCPLDSDGDGIPDYLDECPNSPAGAKVLPNGCALSGDCRKPRPGEEVDANGCAVDRGFILRGVKFEFDSAILTQEARRILDRVSETLVAYPEINVELEGHTDNIGTAAYNLGLSERRAIAVKEYLVGRGIAANRMVPVGYGLTQPIADNGSEDGREENRRVELTVRD